MAAAPFVLVTSTPGDTDIVSQFPTLDRADKVVIQTWINTDHNVDGTHTKAQFVQVGTLLSDGTTTTVAPTPASNRTAIYRDTDGALKTKRGEDSTVEFLGGVPPGFIGHTASATIPQGWLLCDGTAVSRSTYARLFTALGTLYGAGDGSTTFNVPDLLGRTIFGKGGTRITAAGGNFDGTVLGGTGGLQNHTLITAELPAHNHTITDPGHVHTQLGRSFNQGHGSPANQGPDIDGVFDFLSGSKNTSVVTNTTGITINNTGSGTAHTILPPAIVLNPIIRT